MAPAEPGDHPLFIGGDHDHVDVSPPAQCLSELLLKLAVVFADPACEGQHIHSAQTRGHGAEHLEQAMAEHLKGANRPVVTVFGGRPDLPHVAAQAG